MWEITAFQTGFPRFLVGTGLTAALLVVASYIYIKLTPWKELALVKNQNGAAGLALAGAIAGLALPLAASLASATSYPDLLIWGTVALLLQLIAYRVIDLLLSDLPRRIEEDQAGPAIVLIGAKLSSAMILAAGLWDPHTRLLT